jgi:hypothetical protein
MKTDQTTTASISRTVALAGLIALNAALPAEAIYDCKECAVLGETVGCLLNQPTGFETCVMEDDHCDVMVPCS